jgi:aldehyde dehydrogenase (NAD+)
MSSVAMPSIERVTFMKTVAKHYINGQFVESHGRESLDLINPSTERIIGRVILGDEQDTRDAIRAAKEAFKTFSKTSMDMRARYLQALHDAVIARVDEHIAVMVEEYGGVYQFCDASARRAAQSFLEARRALEEIQFTKSVGKSLVSLEPLGVAGLITPWNASTSFICGKVAAAIAAGCTVVVKPSELSALQTQLLMECFDKAGLPPGVINIVIGRGDVVGAEITRNPDIAKISFTGSTVVGKTIARDAVATMKRVTLELGGKSPNVLLEDADLDKAVPFAVAAAFMNNGQACINGTRLLVPESRLAEVKVAIREAVKGLKIGDPAAPDTAIGPLVTRKQYDRVQAYIKRGIEEGAEVIIGGQGHPTGLESGYFVKPTIFVNVTNDMTIAREEIFGPVLCVITYETEEQAIAIANDTSYGLHAYVATSDPARGREVANQIVAGRVMVNAFYDEPRAPFGGFKQSGVGREFGVYGIEAFLEPKAVFAA